MRNKNKKIARAIKERDESYSHFYDYGVMFMERGDYRDAIIAFGAASDVNPLDKSSRIQKGLAFMELSEFTEAIDEFSNIIYMYPDPEIVIAAVHELLGNSDLSSASLSESIKEVRMMGAAYFNRGLAYMKFSDYDNSVADFVQAIKVDPSLKEVIRDTANRYDSNVLNRLNALWVEN